LQPTARMRVYSDFQFRSPYAQIMRNTCPVRNAMIPLDFLPS
jgi:hypothetical protein